jgi:hypothetical protein
MNKHKRHTLDIMLQSMPYSVLKVSSRIIFWGSHSDSKRVFRLQKKIIRIMTGSKSRIPCKPLFKALEIHYNDQVLYMEIVWLVPYHV